MDDSSNESLIYTGCKNGRAGNIKPNQYSNPMDFIIPILSPSDPVPEIQQVDTGIQYFEENL